MKLKYRLLTIITIILISMTNTDTVEAKTRCKSSGSGTNLYQSCVSDFSAATKRINMSDVHYFPNGGTLSRSSTTSGSVTSNSSFSYSVSLFTVAELKATFGIAVSITQSVGISASWIVHPKEYAQVRAIFPQKSMRWDRYNWEGELTSFRTGTTNTNNGFYITAETWK